MCIPMITIVRNLIFVLLILITAVTSGCIERKRNNPFEPGSLLAVNLRIIAFDQRIELSWNRPELSGFSAFNLYRSETGSAGNFTVIATGISPNKYSYTDADIENGKRYYYYLTVTSLDIESGPSQVVSAFPGPGFNWVVDRYDYAVVKLTYDLQNVLLRIVTSSPPEDFVISSASGTGLILLPEQGMIRRISLNDGQDLNVIESIRYPYRAEYDSDLAAFWLVDSSGLLYKLEESSLYPQVIYSALEKPVSLTLSAQTNAIYLADPGSRSFEIISKNGDLIERIDRIADRSLVSPQKIIFDNQNQHYWLLESTAGKAYIYTRHANDSGYHKFELNRQATDMELSPLNNDVYLSPLDDTKLYVLQLYPDSARPIGESKVYKHCDIEINKYDATVLVADSWSGILWHYSPDFQLIGKFPELYTPHKVRVE